MGNEEGQGIGEENGLEIVVDGLGGEEAEFEGGAVGIAEFPEPFTAGFGEFFAGAEEGAGDGERFAAETGGSFEHAVADGVFSDNALGVGDAIVGVASFFEFGGTGEFGAELGFGFGDAAQEFRILETGETADAGFSGVLDAEEFIFGAPGVFGASRAPGGEVDLFAIEPFEKFRVGAVPQVFEFCDGEEPTGSAGMTGDEDKVALLGSGGAPAEEVGGLGRLPVFVGPEEGDIEAETRILEIVRVPTVEGDLLVWSEDESDVGVALVAIEVISTALIEGDDVAAEAGFLKGFLFDF